MDERADLLAHHPSTSNSSTLTTVASWRKKARHKDMQITKQYLVETRAHIPPWGRQTVREERWNEQKEREREREEKGKNMPTFLFFTSYLSQRIVGMEPLKKCCWGKKKKGRKNQFIRIAYNPHTHLAWGALRRLAIQSIDTHTTRESMENKNETFSSSSSFLYVKSRHSLVTRTAQLQQQQQSKRRSTSTIFFSNSPGMFFFPDGENGGHAA